MERNNVKQQALNATFCQIRHDSYTFRFIRSDISSHSLWDNCSFSTVFFTGSCGLQYYVLGNLDCTPVVQMRACRDGENKDQRVGLMPSAAKHERILEENHTPRCCKRGREALPVLFIFRIYPSLLSRRCSQNPTGLCSLESQHFRTVALSHFISEIQQSTYRQNEKGSHRQVRPSA